MQECDTSWTALLQPGQATTYFVGHQRIPFHAHATVYSQTNAWWLAELSRLIYRQARDDSGEPVQGPTRQYILQAVGLQEMAFFDDQGTQCALIRSVHAGPEAYAVLAFCGTNELEDWRNNIQALSLPDLQLEPWARGGRVHLGFRQALGRVWEAVETVLAQMPCPLFYTGHSLGGALATLAASQHPPRALYTFGSPRVGDRAFAATLASCPTFRVVNNRDIVTRLPPPVHGLCHVGDLHYITHEGRFVSNPPQDLVAAERHREDLTFDMARSVVHRLLSPPQFLADHAPINYVAHLARSLCATAL